MKAYSIRQAWVFVLWLSLLPPPGFLELKRLPGMSSLLARNFLLFRAICTLDKVHKSQIHKKFLGSFRICICHRWASPQIADMQICVKYCTTLSQKILKIFFLTDFCTNSNLHAIIVCYGEKFYLRSLRKFYVHKKVWVRKSQMFNYKSANHKNRFSLERLK